MASGKTHNKINSTVMGIVVLALFSYNLMNDISIFYIILGFFIGTFYLGPDLDLKSSVYYRWGYLKFIWHPYQKMLSHRSFLSHFPVVSDFIRYIWITVMYFLFFLSPYVILKYYVGDVTYVKFSYLMLTIAVLIYVVITNKIGKKRKKKLSFELDFGTILFIFFLLNSGQVLLHNQPLYAEVQTKQSIEEFLPLLSIFVKCFIGTCFATILHSSVDIIYSKIKRWMK